MLQAIDHLEKLIDREWLRENGRRPRIPDIAIGEQDDERWPATILRSVEDVAALKETEGGPISVHGSATLGQGLADAGLVDRYHLVVFPLLLGAGKRLFGQADRDTTKLRLVEHQTYSNGVQMQVLDVVH